MQKLREVYSDAKIVSILPLWTKSTKNDLNYKKEERDCLVRLYAKYSDYALDGHSLMPFDEHLYADTVHPNDAGSAMYGENLAKELASILKLGEEAL